MRLALSVLYVGWEVSFVTKVKTMPAAP